MRADGVSRDPFAALHLLKTHARVLHREAQTNHATALQRLRGHPELRSLDDGWIATQVKRRHCLAVAAAELGFDSWPQAAQILQGNALTDRGRLLCPEKCMVFMNFWSASYALAQAARAQADSYLLTYRRQYLVVDRHYIAALGVNPDDDAWHSMNRDWGRVGHCSARRHLYAQVVAGAIRDWLQRGPQFTSRSQRRAA